MNPQAGDIIKYGEDEAEEIYLLTEVTPSHVCYIDHMGVLGHYSLDILDWAIILPHGSPLWGPAALKFKERFIDYQIQTLGELTKGLETMKLYNL